MLSGPYFVLLQHQWVDQSDPFYPTAWMGRHITPQNAMYQARYLAGSFQKVRVWNIQKQKIVGSYLQHAPLSRDDLDPGFEEFYKAVLERPEGVVHTIKRRSIHAFNRHDRNADYEARRKRGEFEHNRSDEGKQENSEDVRSTELGESD